MMRCTLLPADTNISGMSRVAGSARSCLSRSNPLMPGFITSEITSEIGMVWHNASASSPYCVLTTLRLQRSSMIRSRVSMWASSSVSRMGLARVRGGRSFHSGRETASRARRRSSSVAPAATPQEESARPCQRSIGGGPAMLPLLSHSLTIVSAGSGAAVPGDEIQAAIDFTVLTRSCLSLYGDHSSPTYYRAPAGAGR